MERQRSWHNGGGDANETIARRTERQGSSGPLKVSTISRQLSAFSQSSAWSRQQSALSQQIAEGADEFPELDELEDTFEIGGTPTSSVRSPSPGPAQERPPTPKPIFADALLSRGAQEQRPGPRAPEPAPVETQPAVITGDVPRTELQAFVGNLPRSYTEEVLLEELWDGGFRRGADFDALRMVEDGARLGCVIAFRTAFARNAFVAAFHGRKLRGASVRAEDVVTVTAARAAGPARPPGPPSRQWSTVPLAMQLKAVRALPCALGSAVPPGTQGHAAPAASPGKAFWHAGQDTMFCPSCGDRQAMSSKFCGACGTRLPQMLLLLGS